MFFPFKKGENPSLSPLRKPTFLCRKWEPRSPRMSFHRQWPTSSEALNGLRETKGFIRERDKGKKLHKDGNLAEIAYLPRASAKSKPRSSPSPIKIRTNKKEHKFKAE